MKCNGCDTEFDKASAGSGIDFTTDAPQTFQDSWRNRDRTVQFKGNCFGCGRRTYAFDDGENDPRGPLGDNAASPLLAEDYDKKGPEVPLCFGCSNEYEAYNAAADFGHKIWDRNPEAEARSAEQEKKWREQRKGFKTAQDDTHDPDNAVGNYVPRVDPFAQKALDKALRKQVDQEAGKLQKNIRGLDQFAGFKNSEEIKIAANPFGKELKKVRKALAEEGWTEEETTAGWRFKAPKDQIISDGQNPGGIVVTHGSPSDHRAFKNFLGDLKNTTGFTWPPDRKKKVEEAPSQGRHMLNEHGVDTAGFSDEEIEQLHSMAHEDEAVG
jgi:hypothetical protein